MFVSRALLGSVLLFAGLSHAATTTLTARSILTADDVIDPSAIPSECSSQCSVLLNAVNTCTTDACVCTNDVNTGFQSCYGCLLSLLGVDDAAVDQAVQSNIAKFEDACDQAGFALSSLTVSTPAATATVPASEQISSIPGFTLSLTATGSGASVTASNAASSAYTPQNAGLLAWLGIAGLFLV